MAKRKVVREMSASGKTSVQAPAVRKGGVLTAPAADLCGSPTALVMLVPDSGARLAFAAYAVAVAATGCEWQNGEVLAPLPGIP